MIHSEKVSKKRSYEQMLAGDLMGTCRSAHDLYVLFTEECKYLSFRAFY